MANGKGRDTQREVQWRRVVLDQQRSGLTIRDFCRRRKLRESAFYFWRGELERRRAERLSGVALAKPQEQRGDADPPAPPAFVPVQVEEHIAAVPAGCIEIELSGGRRIHVTAPVDRQALADVLAVLEGRPC